MMIVHMRLSPRAMPLPRFYFAPPFQAPRGPISRLLLIGLLGGVGFGSMRAEDNSISPKAAEFFDRAADISQATVSTLDAILQGQPPTAFGSMRPLRPVAGALPGLSQAGAASFASCFRNGAGFPFFTANALTLVVLTKLPEGQPSSLLSSMGEAGADLFTLATDREGAPFVAFLDTENRTTQICRAKMGAANLADGGYHWLVVTVNFSSGLVRLYVDGEPEAAAVISLWRPETINQAVVLSSPSALPIQRHRGQTFAARLLNRELTSDEIAMLKPRAEQPPENGTTDLPLLDTKFVAHLFENTLIEFLPFSAFPSKTRQQRN